MNPTTNNTRTIVPLEPLLEHTVFWENKAALPVAIGRDAEGNPKVIDLAEAPHILMAGATKQGKTTAVHSLILSLLSSRNPDEVKFVFIDPKDWNLRAYKALIEDYIAESPDVEKKAVLTTAEEAEKVLHSLCLELEKRYGTLADNNVKNIRKYNAQAEDGRQMPYIVTVIDEYSDFLSFHRCDRKSREISCDIFNHIICLAQKGRAVGMHLVITTQRPSPEVISRIIKVNFTTRMAFRVASKQNSLTIIDTPGAERLIGNGDMIFSSGGETTRIQGAFVDNNDIDAVIRSISSRQSGGERHDVQYCLPAVEDAKPECTGCGGLTDLHCLDDRFKDAAKLVVSTQIGAASHLQRNL